MADEIKQRRRSGGGSESESGGEQSETGFRDVSAEVEQAKEDAQKPVEFDDDGKPKPQSSEAAAVVADEQSRRASAQANGGGPWPAELLVKVGTTVGRAENLQPPYTSHLSEKEQEEAAA